MSHLHPLGKVMKAPLLFTCLVSKQAHLRRERARRMFARTVINELPYPYGF